ncbi:MAG: methyltransferase domain-containing protein [Myxococcaceae bacterium]|nr:methyltransferase domain-containing protein [Myxococcaceae bacterium]
MAWDPQQYLKFREQRFAPFEDLVSLIQPRPGMRGVDLGCGTGELTARLLERLPGSQLLGMDSSAEMLARASALAGPQLSFAKQDLRGLEGEWDLLFSHAALQWVDEHERLISELFARLTWGGQLAVQMPANDDHYTHAALREVAGEAPFREALAGWVRTSPVLPVERYAELLFSCGAEHIHARLQVYGHVLEDADALLEWTRGTTMLPYIERLPAELQERFVSRYREKLRERFPQRPVFYAFKRILFAATRP